MLVKCFVNTWCRGGENQTINRFKLRFSPCYPYGEAEDVSLRLPEPGPPAEAGDLQLPSVPSPRTVTQ